MISPYYEGRLSAVIRIDNNRCCGCGHCQFIRTVLPLLRSIDGVDYYEDPRPEDQKFVENMIAECWASAISIEK